MVSASPTSRGKWHAPLLVTVLALLPVAAMAQGASPDLGDYDLQLVQIVHRHGARSPVMEFNVSQICSDVACGQLNIQGREMLLNAGTYLRAQYGEASPHALLSDVYDPLLVYTRSTDMDRTLQSATALLRTLFPSTTNNSNLPVIHTREFSTDYTMLPYLAPSTSARLLADKDAFDALMSAAIEPVLSDATILQMAREAYMEGACTNPTQTARENRVKCAGNLFDVGAAFRSRGILGDFPTLAANFAELERIMGIGNAFHEGYNGSDPYHQQRGSPGYPLARTLLNNMHSKVDGTNSYKLMHYSGHDLTVAPLVGTLGDNSAVGMMPPYSTMVILELLVSRTTGAPVVRVLRGGAGLTPDTGFVFTAAPLTTMKCKMASGTVYAAPQGVCPLGDLERFVESSAPRSVAGSDCYVTDAYRAAMACPAVDSDDSPSSLCATYRASCAQSACPGGSYLAADGSGRCLSLASLPNDTPSTLPASAYNAPPNRNTVSTGGAVAIAIGSCVAGAVLCLLACLLFHLQRRGNGFDGHRGPDQKL